MDNLILEIRKLDLKEGDVIHISYSNNISPYTDIDDLFNTEEFQAFIEEKKITIVYFPEEFNLQITSKDEMIKHLERMITELKETDEKN